MRPLNFNTSIVVRLPSEKTSIAHWSSGGGRGGGGCHVMSVSSVHEGHLTTMFMSDVRET